MITNYGVHQISSPTHALEDRYRVLNQSVKIVGESPERGHVYMVADGVGGADLGMQTAQQLADNLTPYYLAPEQYPPGTDTLRSILYNTNVKCHGWGLMDGTDRTKAGSTVSLLHFNYEKEVRIMHVGDTVIYHVGHLQKKCLTTTHDTQQGLINYVGVGDPFHVECVDVNYVEEGDFLSLIHI